MLGEQVDLDVVASLVSVEEGLFARLGAVERGRGRVLADLDAFGPGRLADGEGEQGGCGCRCRPACRRSCPWLSTAGVYSVIVTATVPPGPMPSGLIVAFVEPSWNWWAPLALDCSRTVHPAGTGAVKRAVWIEGVERRRRALGRAVGASRASGGTRPRPLRTSARTAASDYMGTAQARLMRAVSALRGPPLNPKSMRMRGLEPPPGFPDTDLNRARLPIPPHPRAGRAAEDTARTRRSQAPGPRPAAGGAARVRGPGPVFRESLC